MFNQVQICNFALQSQGANPITSLGDNIKEAKLCNAFWDMVRDFVLATHNWSFALKWATLAQDGSATILDDRYVYAYTLPGDFIRLSRTGNKKVNYERRGNVIMSNDTMFSVEYVYRVENTGLYPVHFVDAFVARLRAELSLPLNKDGAKLIDWYGVFDTILANSMAADAQQSNPYLIDDVGHVDSTETFITSRNG